MSKITIELCSDTIDNIIVAQLQDTWHGLKNELGAGHNIFVWGDPDQDNAMIQKHIDALELLLSWYSTPEQMKEMGLSYES